MKKPSKTQAKKAGDLIRLNPNDESDIDVLNIWRAHHIYLLNIFQTVLFKRYKAPITTN